MATLQIKLENGFFTSTNGVYVNEFRPSYINGNGWDCKIHTDGSIFCECARDYSDGVHSIRYTIRKDGFAKLTLKTPYSFEILRKGYVTSKGVAFGSGLLGLAGGYVDQRYAYFRDATFQKFLDKFGLTAVKHENPNQKFSGFSARTGLGTAYMDVFTDGNVTWNYEDTGSREVFEAPGANPNLYTGKETNKVSDGTWAIVETVCNYGDSHNFSRILYTEKNVIELEEALMANEAIAEYVKKRAS